MEEESKSTKKGGMKMGVLQAFIMGIIAILVLVVFGGVFYGVRGVKNVSDSGFALGVAKTFNLSAAKINGLKVSYVDYMDDLQTLKKFYSDQADLPQPTEEEISDQVISRLMANTLIADIAKDYDVEVLQTDIDETKAQLLSQFPDEEAAETELMSRYGWTLEKYIQKVVKPLLLEQKLQKTFEENVVEEGDENGQEQLKASHILFAFDPDTDKEDTRATAQEVLNKIKDGADFAEMAAQYGSDGTKDNGGDLGWFGRGVMVPEFEEAVFALETGELSDELVETSFGYHIIKVEDRRYTRDFVSFMDDEIKNSEIEILINIHNPFESLLNAEGVEMTQIDADVIDDTEDTEDLEDVDTEVTDDVGDSGDDGVELAE